MTATLAPPPEPKQTPAMEEKTSSATRSRAKKGTRIFIGLVVLGALGFLLTGLVVPRIVAWQARKFTGRSFRFGFLVVLPNGRVTVSARGAQLLNKDFHLDSAQARLDWWNVLFHRIRVGYIDLADARFQIEKNPAGEWIINGVNTSKVGSAESGAEPTTSVQTPPSKPWAVGFGKVTFKNLEFDYRSPEINSVLHVNRLYIGPAESWRPESATPIEADLVLNGSPIFLKGTYTPFSAAPHIQAAITIRNFPLKPWAAIVAKSGIEQLVGHISLKGHIDSRYETKHGLFKGQWDARMDFVDVGGLSQKAPKTKNGYGKKLRFNINGPIDMKGMNLQLLNAGSESSRSVFKIAELKNAGNVRLELHDETFHRPPVFRMNPFDFSVTNISTIHPDQPLAFDFKAVLGKYDRFSAKGYVTPFAKKLNGKFSARIKELDLTPYTGYSERYTGSRIQTGVFNMDSETSITDDQLEAKNFVVLKKLEFQYINREKEDERTARIGIPTNVVLALIKDKYGNIELNVPVTGPASDPDVGFGSLMAKITATAIGIAAEKAAEYFFPPLKTINLLVSGIQFATKWRFQPLIFEPGTLNMTKETEEYLSAVGKKLQERPNVQLTVCGFGTLPDLAPGKKIKKTELLAQEKRDQLLKLATDRSVAVKDFLVNRFTIDSSRLLMCTPAADEDESALPRTTLSL